MIVENIEIQQVEVSEFNTRKNLADGQFDSTIEDLARSIERQGLLSPITVFRKPSGRYALIAGQRRLIACKRLGWSEIPAIVRDTMSDADATAVSLVENVHRADMNPRDKAVAFNALLGKFGDLLTIGRETGGRYSNDTQIPSAIETCSGSSGKASGRRGQKYRRTCATCSKIRSRKTAAGVGFDWRLHAGRTAGDHKTR